MSLSLPHLPRRLIIAREKAGLTQADLSKKIGIKDRQTIASMESGQRRITVEELLAIMAATGQEMDYFTDPFRLTGEAAFSYRASGVSDAVLDAFEEKAERWIATWRYLGEKRGESPGLMRQSLSINERSNFEEAQAAGESVGSLLELGAVPAEKLASAIETQFGVLILHVDMPKGVSGAACQLKNGDSILVNRKEAEGRRNFDLAHELFHVLTWDALPPERVDRENPSGSKQKRTEQMADNFSGALLMPATALKPLWDKSLGEEGLFDWLKATARHFHVSVSALKWRLVVLGWMSKKEAQAIEDETYAREELVRVPRLFSRQYMERIMWAVDRGEMSVNRIMELLDLDLDSLKELFFAHGVPYDIGL